MHTEQLEDRRLLAVFSVTNLSDGAVGGPTDLPGSLRQAIWAANTVPGPDAIVFDPTLSGGTIALTAGELAISESLVINAAALPDKITIDAQHNSRVLNFSDASGNLTLAGVNVQHGQSSQGAGVNFSSSGTFGMVNSSLSGNSATLTGGGVRTFNGNVVLTASTISDNSSGDKGAGIYGASVTLTTSTISGNSSAARGGGIYSGYGSVSVTRSTISDNLSGGKGGGIYNRFDALSLTGTTVSGNSSSDDGGGVWTDNGSLTVDVSTFTGNSATGDGGGIYSDNLSDTVSGSLLAGNLASGVGNEIRAFSLDLDAYNLIGDSTQTEADALDGVTVGATDILATSDGANVTRGSILDTTLADNGGPTFTHALLPGSPAIHAGDPTFDDTLIPTDQRGFARVFFSRVDIGAVEFIPASAPELIVSTTDDLFDGDFSEGNYSLREVVEVANEVTGSNTIVFAASLDGATILMDDGSGEIVITDEVIIDATSLANGVTIDAGHGADNLFGTGDGYRIFHINDGTTSDIPVQLHGLTLTGGDVGVSSVELGGAILSFESLTITGSTVVGNAATGETIVDVRSFYNAIDHVAITDSTITGNQGRAVDLQQVDQSSITRTSITANEGGGVKVDGGRHVIEDSTIANNSGSLAQGVGIWNFAGELSVVNSTISGNSASSFSNTIYSNGLLDVEYSTITDNDADAIYAYEGGTIRMRSSIIAGNTGAPVSQTGTVDIQSAGYNLFDASSFWLDPSDQVTSDPLLGPLTDNGGPTATHALLAGSPAINMGDPASMAGTGDVPLFDQRGAIAPRVMFGRIDIGAYEFDNATIPGGGLVVDTINDLFNGDYSAGDLSLREAVELANANGGADTITFAPELAGQTILLTGGQLELTETVTMDASSLADNLTVDAQQNSGVLHFSGATGDLTLNGLNIQQGMTTDDFDGGGGIRFDSDGMLSLTDSTVRDNTTTGYGADGGGIFTVSGTVHLTGSTVSDNTSSYEGGGISTFVGTVTLIDSTVSGNMSTFDGGGIYSQSGAVSLTNSVVNDNVTTATQADGGGIGTLSGDVTLTDSEVSGNVAGGVGGGIYAESGHVTLEGSTVSGNSGRDGGGVFAEYGNVTVNGTTLSGNTADQDGGAIYMNLGHLYVTDSTLSGNVGTGSSDGGAIYSFQGDVTVDRSTLSGNTARWGGALVAYFGAITVSESTLSGNSVDRDGGAIYRAYPGPTTISGSTIAGNTAAYEGGGIYIRDNNDAFTLTLHRTIVAANVATSGPDLFVDPDSTLDFGYSLIGDNTDTLLAEAQSPDLNGNVIGSAAGMGVIDPLLGMLADNGGPTRTHALLAGSPAIDGGDPGAMAGMGDVPLFDQRGVGFDRVSNGRIDIGAFELQAATVIDCDFDDDGACDIGDIDALVAEIVSGASDLAFDLNGDGAVDLNDRDQWLVEAGAMNLPSGNAYLLGDSNLDGTVDGQDFIVWNNNKFQSSGLWSLGDWNADGTTDGQDFILWNNNKFQSADDGAALVDRVFASLFADDGE